MWLHHFRLLMRSGDNGWYFDIKLGTCSYLKTTTKHHRYHIMALLLNFIFRVYFNEKKISWLASNCSFLSTFIGKSIQPFLVQWGPLTNMLIPCVFWPALPPSLMTQVITAITLIMGGAGYYTRIIVLNKGNINSKYRNYDRLQLYEWEQYGTHIAMKIDSRMDVDFWSYE